MQSAPSRRILFAAGRLTGGGAERQLMQLATALHELGSTVTVATLSSEVEGVPFRQVVLWNGKRRSRLGTAAHLLRAGLRLRHVVREERPDVVISWLAIPTMLVGHMVASMGVPTIMAIRNSSPERNRSLPLWLQHALLRSAASKFGMVIANSSAGILGYRAINIVRSQPVYVIPNCIDTSRFRVPSPEERTIARAALMIPDNSNAILYVGRASPEKNVPMMVATLARVADTMLDARLVIVGLRRESIDRASRDAGICLPRDRLILLERVTRIEHVYWACDALVLTSVREGSPNVVHEARACGLPVVSTDVGDVRSTQTDADRVVRSDCAELSGALIELLASATVRQASQSYLDPAGCARLWLVRVEELLGQTA